MKKKEENWVPMVLRLAYWTDILTNDISKELKERRRREIIRFITYCVQFTTVASHVAHDKNQYLYGFGRIDILKWNLSNWMFSFLLFLHQFSRKKNLVHSVLSNKKLSKMTQSNSTKFFKLNNNNNNTNYEYFLLLFVERNAVHTRQKLLEKENAVHGSTNKNVREFHVKVNVSVSV